MSKSGSSSESSNSKRTAHLSPASKLHICVSQWTHEDVEKELHIFCSDAVTPSFILEKITNEELSEKQSEYVEKVKSYLHFDIKFMELIILPQSVAYDPSTRNARPLSDVIEDTMENSMKDPDRFVRSTIGKFMVAVQELARNCKEIRSQTKIYEGTFTRFISDFAELCCLKPKCTLGNAKGEASVWENFRNLNCAISNPDIRLMKCGLPEELRRNYKDTECPVVSIVQVKMPSDLKVLNVPNKDPVDELARRMEFTRLQRSAANSSSAESTSSDSVSMDSSRNYRRKKNPSNMISGSWLLPISKGHKVFGQHAGELLFDLNRCLKDSEATIGRMPGMIVDGVKVIFTLLEIQVLHLEKLRTNKKLDDGDRALIYYTAPYDIFIQTDRNIVLEYFMKLNNMMSYGYSDLDAKSTQDGNSAYSSDVQK